MKEFYVCLICKENLPVSHFTISGIGFDKRRGSSYCKKCSNKKNRERKREIKKQCVEYKGGSCHLCGYNKCLQALDFHHRDPNQKDFALSTVFCFTDKVQQELDKCDLLCRNCHAEVHYLLRES